MFRFLRLVLVLILLFLGSTVIHCNEQTLCDLEIKKENPDKIILEKECEALAKEYEKNKKYGFASWYYVLAYKNDYNIKHLANKPGIELNIAHSYVLLEKLEKAKELYEIFLATYMVPMADISMHEDYTLLNKLYPNSKKSLANSMAFWNEIYKPLLPVNVLDKKYKKAKEENRHSDEIIYLNEIIELQKKYQNKDNIHIYNNMIWLSAAYYHNKEYKKSIELLHDIENKKIEDIYRLYFLYYMANNYVGLKEYENAFSYYMKTLDMQKKQTDKNDMFLSKVYKELGALSGLMEKNNEAIEYLNKALKIQRKIKNEDASTAIIYNHIGDLLRVRGDELEAYSYYEKSLDISKRVLGKNNVATADRYSKAGILYKQMGDNKKSLKYFEKALAIREQLKLKDASIATNYSDIGVLHDVMKDYERAHVYHTRSLSIRENILGKKHPDTATSYNNIGSVYQDEENYSTALDYYEKSLQTRQEVLGEEHLDTATSYNNIGGVYHQEGDYSKALDYYMKSLEIRKNILGEKHRITATSYNNISTLYGDKEEHSQAHHYAKESFSVFIENRNKNFRILNNKQKRFYLESNKYVVSLLLKTAYLHKEYNTNKHKQINISQQIINSWLVYKGSIFDSENAIATLYGNTKDKVLKEKIDSLIINKRILAKLYQSLPKPKERKQWKKNIKQTEEKIGDLTNEISKKAHSFKESQGLKNINYKDISKNLKENELYIDYAKTGKYYYVFSLDKKENIHFTQIDENSTKKIDTLVKTFREDVASILDNNMITDKKLKQLTVNSKKKLSKLYDLVLNKPLSNSLKDKTNLIFSPDGALRLLPFEAMFNKETNKYLIEQNEIRYVPSGKELVRLYKYANIKADKENDTTVIFSNPNFNAKIKKNDLQDKEEVIITPNTSRAGVIKSLFRMRFAPLPGTKAEAASIKSTLKNEKLREYKEEEASESNLMKVKEPKILHIATHGFFINDKSIPNPMLKSGIALSGANKSVIKGKSDGVVTALKLSGLDLRGTDLVVLSACQTGVVDINSTDSVSGLSKAFIQAGAKDIVMSLWSVNDESTKDLMSSFYQEIQKDLSYAKALKSAKLKMIHKGMHPFYWAPFIVNGL